MRRLFIRNDRIKNVFHHNVMIGGLLEPDSCHETHDVQEHYADIVQFLQFDVLSAMVSLICTAGILLCCSFTSPANAVWTEEDESQRIAMVSSMCYPLSYPPQRLALII
ncbi:unnamed protein product [Heligmosomoides polygyrus]|uniref:Neur_chan_memb domain-containing protein n=1 Tax=Heligmosomoides polygyrus TaxID=6339 RepID=A0A3P7ZQ59_HELPZ|nr:unnamed protein product [Heligmosomoides polygyrus]